jgi:hypothetical protein
MAALFFPNRDLMKAIAFIAAFMAIIEQGKFGKKLNKQKFESLRDNSNGFPVIFDDLKLLQSDSKCKGEGNFLQRGGEIPNTKDKRLPPFFL